MSPRTLPAPLSRLRRANPTVQIALFIALSTAAALVHVHLRLAVLQAGYELSRQTRLRHELEDQNQKLRLELETRRDPSVIERRAREDLAMAPPDPAAIRIVRPDGTLLTPLAPTGTSGDKTASAGGAAR